MVAGQSPGGRGRFGTHDEAWAISPGSILTGAGELADGLDVVVRAGMVEAVTGRGEHGLPSDRVVEAPDATLLPGLIDSHVHLTFSADAQVVDNVVR